jgi:Flp pilus assembly protein TadG
MIFKRNEGHQARPSHGTSSGEASARVGALARGRRWPKDSGAEAAEFAMVLPVLLLLLTGITQFGVTLYNYEMLTGGVRAASRNFAISFGTTTPWSGTKTVLTNASPGLNATTLGNNMILQVNGTICSSDIACTSAITTARAAGDATGTVKATYPCNIQIMAINAAPGCVLSQTTTELVQ